MKLVSVIIPSLHRPDLTSKCLESLRKQTLKTDLWEAIVVENDAQVGSILPDPLPANTRRILLTENLGTTGSINRGAAISSSEYILLLNNDVILAPNFLEFLVGAIEHHKCGFVTGKLLQGNNVSLLDGAGDAILQSGGAYRLRHGDPDLGEHEQETVVLSGCGAATLLRRSIFEEVDGLDEDFFAYLDDIDLAVRFRLRGHQGMYVPQAVAYHLGSTTLGHPQHPRIVYLLTRNQLLLVLKDYPSAVLWHCLPRILFFQLLWFALVARQHRLLPYLKGLASVIRYSPRILRKRQIVNGIRRIHDDEFLEALRASEGQIRAWQKAVCPPSSPSWILRAYFGFFQDRD